MKKPTTLIIMDGFGLNPAVEGNAIKASNTPNLDRLFSEYPCTPIGASGMDVGLPDGQMGNSEVGHTNIGAGRVVYQELTRITKSIADGDFYSNKVLCEAMTNAKKDGQALHLMGLVSDGGVHSHNTHLYALLRMAKYAEIDKVYVHAMLDGRDVPPASGVGFIEELEAEMQKIGAGEIATVMGRYYGMDRDTQWARVEKAYAAMAYREGILAGDAAEAVRASYAAIDEEGKHITDEFVIPTVIGEAAPVRAGDSVIFFNFRPDRARELTRAFVDPAFSGFERRGGMHPLFFVCMTEYDATMPNVHVAFEPRELTMTMGETVSKAGLTQLRIAETTKYAHVTFFYNGGEEVKFPGEDRVLIPTPDVATFDLKPEMSAYPVCDAVVERITSGTGLLPPGENTSPEGYDMIILNFANCDMVGHTGIMDAAIAAVETVDECVGRVVDATLSMGGTAIITADHGNADKMIDTDGQPFTAHTTFPVPFCVVTPAGVPHVRLREGGRLADISPTMLKLMNVAKPAEMDGESLVL